MSRINGGYGLMLQISQGMIDEAMQAFYDSNRDLFSSSSAFSSEITRYGISQRYAVTAGLSGIKLVLGAGRRFELGFEVKSSCRISTRLAALPGGGMPPAAPELEVGLRARIWIGLDATYRRRGGKSYLSLDLQSMDLIGFEFSIVDSNVTVEDRGLAVMGTLIRRKAIHIIRRQVREIPVSFTIKESIPFLGTALDIHADYKIVSSGGAKALALLLEVDGYDANWDEVVHAIPVKNDLGLFIDRRLLSTAVEAAERFLPGISLKQDDPNNIKRNGTFIINDVRLSLGYDCLNVENVEIQLRVFDIFQKEVRKVICYLMGGACGIKVCDTILEYVMEEVLQLDQLANIHGTLTPRVKDKKIYLDPDLDADVARWAMFVIYSLGATILPAGGLITPILMIIGDVMLDRKVNEMVSETTIDAFVKQSFPNSNLSVEAYASDIAWTGSTMGILGNVEFST